MRRVLGWIIVPSTIMSVASAGCIGQGDTNPRQRPDQASSAGTESGGTEARGTSGAASGGASTGGATVAGAAGEAPSTGGATVAGAAGEAPSTGGATVAGAAGEAPSTGGEGGAGGGGGDATFCATNQRVADNQCVPCPPGTTNEAGDDASGVDTACDPVLCGQNEHVVGNACEPCPDGGFGNVAGDDASGEDTACDGDLCAVNQYVSEGACVPCPAGMSNAAGDDATGADTSCAPILCSADQHVVSNACSNCPPGSTNAAGDDATGGDTTCDATLCAANQHVVNHLCTACPAGSTNAAGDDATGGDTTCDVIFCTVNQHVVNHACVACPGDLINEAGDDATGPDTTCDDPVANYAFVSPSAVTGDLAGLSGADAMCDSWASAAGIPGTYRAILSTANVDARDRLQGARGWVRPDGRPVADWPSELFGSPLPLAPIRLGPDGTDLGERSVWSASGNNGIYKTTANGTDCNSWTASSAALAWYGFSDTTAEWLDRGTDQACSSSAHLYCFQIDYYHPLSLEDFAQSGRILFVSSTSFDVTTGITGADAICAADAAGSGLPGAYRALLAGDGSSAVSRFSNTNVLVVRPDGLVVAQNIAELSTADLVHPPSMRNDGGYYSFRVFTGASLPNAAGTSSTTCGGWSSTAGSGTIGFSHATSRASSERIWFGNGNDGCASRSGTLPVYCLQE